MKDSEENNVCFFQTLMRNFNFDSHGQHLVLLLSGRRNVWKVSKWKYETISLSMQDIYMYIYV